nr:MAG TPA: chromosome partition protein [Caudoviricetes sp.]
MKTVIIKEIRLLNFKGLRDLTVEFDERLTEIYGRNGIGKTSIFDGFTWLLFGKNSEDRKQFGIKTYDEAGNIIPKLPHEVSAVLLVDGEVVTLCRRFNEKWQKKRGSAVEEFVGHEEERLYNDVPCSVKEWNEKIAAICPEQVFKFITNPLYFTAQSVDTQRSMLFRMAGGITDEEIAAGNADFAALLASLTGKTMEEYKKEIAAKKRRLKTEIEAIPERIDERRRDVPEAEDWAALEAELRQKQEALAEVEEQITDAAKAYAAANEARLAKIRKIGDLKNERLALELKIKNEVQALYRSDKAKQQAAAEKLERAKRDKASAERDLANARREIEVCTDRRAELIKQWQSINARKLVFDENEFICPTCKRRFEIEEIESRQQEITENFNRRNAADLEENNRRGKENKLRMEEVHQYIGEIEEKIAEQVSIIAEIEASGILTAQLIEPDATPTIEADADYIALGGQIDALEKEVASDENEPEPASKGELLHYGRNRNSLIAEIDALKSRLMKREQIEKNNQRIAELEKSLRTQSEELAQLEGIEFTMAAFSKARTEAIESKINGLFDFVKFRLFETQINGGEVETCEAMVNGVPFSDTNTAGQFNAGIDIINAICRFEGISAPIFADGSESVNTLHPTQSQVIRLFVSLDDKLVIKHNGNPAQPKSLFD